MSGIAKSSYQLEQCGFTGTVEAEQTVDSPRKQTQRKVLKHILPSGITEMYILNFYHNNSFAAGRTI